MNWLEVAAAAAEEVVAEPEILPVVIRLEGEPTTSIVAEAAVKAGAMLAVLVTLPEKFGKSEAAAVALGIVEPDISTILDSVLLNIVGASPI